MGQLGTGRGTSFSDTGTSEESTKRVFLQTRYMNALSQRDGDVPLRMYSPNAIAFSISLSSVKFLFSVGGNHKHH